MIARSRTRERVVGADVEQLVDLVDVERAGQAASRPSAPARRRAGLAVSRAFAHAGS